jgi:hypothetical protein
MNNMLSNFINTKIANFITWVSGSATLAAILHLLPIVLGVVSSIIFFVIAVYKLRQSICDYEKSRIDIDKTIHQNLICLKDNCPSRIEQTKNNS